jgi:hypothetical protein
VVGVDSDGVAVKVGDEGVVTPVGLTGPRLVVHPL